MHMFAWVLFCHSCPVPVVLSRMSWFYCLKFPVPVVLPLLSYSGWLVLTGLPPNYPILTVLFVPLVLSQVSCPVLLSAYLVPAVLSWLLYVHNRAVLSRSVPCRLFCFQLSCFSCSVTALLFHLSYPSCLVPAVIF
jgi:hypothetical protein